MEPPNDPVTITRGELMAYQDFKQLAGSRLQDCIAFREQRDESREVIKILRAENAKRKAAIEKVDEFYKHDDCQDTSYRSTREFIEHREILNYRARQAVRECLK